MVRCKVEDMGDYFVANGIAEAEGKTFKQFIEEVEKGREYYEVESGDKTGTIQGGTAQ